MVLKNDLNRDYDSIYTSTVANIDYLLLSLKSLDENDEISDIKAAAIADFSSLRNEMQNNIESLRLNSEWEKFTIAFYGETNAGKSTLIEILRILFNEKTKEIERNCFFDANQKRTEIQSKIDSIEESLKKNRMIAEEKQACLQRRINDIEEEINRIEDDWLLLQCQMWDLSNKHHRKLASDFGHFFKTLFNKTEEQENLLQLQTQLTAIVLNHQEKTDSVLSIKKQIEMNQMKFNDENKNGQERLLELEKEVSTINEILAVNSDGKIIDAHTDFTKEVAQYDLDLHGTSISLLDMPGIEGNEQLVQDEINKAIEKAHVVFYVNTHNHAPQKGSETNKGTIEKISDQLSGQTEVYFVFNKRIPGPKKLIPELTTDDDERALNDADSKLKEVFDDKYKGHISLSAYPPFVACGNFFSGPFLKAKSKFLDIFSKEDIIKYSKLETFYDWISNDLSQNYKSKIIRSNIHKLLVTVKKTKKAVESVHKDLHDVYAEVKKDIVFVEDSLQRSKNELLNEIGNIMEANINSYKYAVRNDAYVLIDNDISNKELSLELKRILDEKKTLLDNQTELDAFLREFDNKVNERIKRHQEYVGDLFGFSAKNYKPAYIKSIVIKTKRKGDISVIVSSLISVIFAVMAKSNPVLLILSLIPAAISIGKEVSGFFDVNQKKAQQRRSVDENLKELEKKLKSDVNNNIMEIGNKIDANYAPIVDNLNDVGLQINEATNVHQKCETDLDNLITELERKLYEYF